MESNLTQVHDISGGEYVEFGTVWISMQRNIEKTKALKDKSMST